MTLPEFEELAEYWAEHPPVHILLGAYLGVGKPGRKRANTGTVADPASVLAELGPGLLPGDVHAGLSPVVLDFAELRRRAKAGQ